MVSTWTCGFAVYDQRNRTVPTTLTVLYERTGGEGMELWRRDKKKINGALPKVICFLIMKGNKRENGVNDRSGGGSD